MEINSSSTFRPYLVSVISLFIIGWGGAALAVFTLTPTVWARWLFFFGGTLGLISLALPVAWFLNLRFPSKPPAGATVVARQATWVGIYGALMFWLQQGRLVTMWTGLGLAAGLGAIEYLVRMREMTRWQPSPNQPPVTGEQAPADGSQPARDNDQTIK
jgi:hypothetical protein